MSRRRCAAAGAPRTAGVLARAALVLVAGLAGTATARETGTADGLAAAQELFERGVQAYRRGDHEAARAAWEAVLDVPGLAPEARARVAYDLGNAAWRRGEELEAVGWYTSAVRLDPRHADAWANLELARAGAGLEPADRGDLRSTVHRLLALPRPAERRWAVLAALVLVALPLAGEALRGGRAWRHAALVAAVVLALACVPWLHAMLPGARDPALVVASPGAALRSEPRPDAAATGEVRAGEEVERSDALPGWVRVEGPRGERGWVRASSLFALRR